MKQPSVDLSSGPDKTPPTNVLKGAEIGAWGILSKTDSCHSPSDASLFSCSLPILPHDKLDLNDSNNGHPSMDDTSTNFPKGRLDAEGDHVFDDVESHLIGDLLPEDEDVLLAGMMDDFDLTRLPATLEDLEEYDLFGSGGGMELENDLADRLTAGISKVNLSDCVMGNGVTQYAIPNGVGTVAGEHPYGEHPSRTLFVRNINSNVEDSELRALFEQYGDIRTLYTACKHRGFVMISYYDIRAARTAMRALQNKPLRRRKLDIHFSIPKDNPSDKDINQGTLVVFNLDPSVTNEDLRIKFEACGEVKEIRETPHKRHHKFIEFYDVRAAEAALKWLNKSDIAGKRIKIEPSRPGGARRNLMLQLHQELEQDESRNFRHPVGSPITNSPPGNWAQFNSQIEQNPLQSMARSPVFNTMNPATGNHLPGLASILHSQASNPMKVAPIGKDYRRGSAVEHPLPNLNPNHGAAFQSHSLPESKLSQYYGSMSSIRPSPSNGSVMETLSGPQFLWGSPKPYAESMNPSAWSASSGAHSFSANGRAHGFSYTGQQNPFFGGSSHQLQGHHHVGSAPPVASLERRFGFFPESSDTSSRSPAAFGGMSLGQHDSNFLMKTSGRSPMNPGMVIQRNITESGPSGYRVMPSSRLSPVLLSNGLFPGLAPNTIDGFNERGRSRRVENNGNQVDSKKQFHLDLEKIINGEDARTTLMIKNIPNKYTSKMLLAAIDEKHKGTYNFIYLPIDFKNKCNVGYAFINMLSPAHIVPFYEAFNGKKWEKFNSEKVASLAYARIQGKLALVSHFQNSSLMNEDKRCRPILFRSDTQGGDQEHLPSSSLNVQFRQVDESDVGDSLGSLTDNDFTNDLENI